MIDPKMDFGTDSERHSSLNSGTTLAAHRLFCLGFGQAVAQFVRDHPSLAVSASARTLEKCQWLQARGIDGHLWQDGFDARGNQALRQSTMIVISAPPREGTVGRCDPFFPVLADTVAGMVAQQPEPPIVVYLSSTNVYGNADGAWVDEETLLNPSSSRGEARAQAEADWQSVGARTHIFRLAGIYAQHRNQIRKLLSGKARQLIKPGHVFNRIHEADIAGAIAKALHQPRPGVYNLADDEPAPPQEVLAFAAALSGAPLPAPEQFSTADLRGLAEEFYRDNKRVRNHRLKHWLGRGLMYPNFRIGLTAIWRQMQQHT